MVYNRKKRKYIIPLNNRSKTFLHKGKNEIKIIAVDSKNNQTELIKTVVY
jgi:hypothetical protein